MKLHPALTFGELRGNRVVIGFHASEDSDFTPNNKTPLHVGSIQQSQALIKNMMRKNPALNFYLYEVKVNLLDLAPYLHDEDPVSSSNYDVIAYSNRVEFPQGMKMGDNISLFLSNADHNVIGLRRVPLE
jgi:hypothetical protein